MPYIIDGHNLIPKITGLSLDEIDDENQLIELLQEFCRRERKQVEVFFDNAPPGGARARNFGSVIARFVRQGRTADDAISAKLNRLGGSARNYTVVSSDHAVQAAARAKRARVLSSEEYAVYLTSVRFDNGQEQGKGTEANLSPQELEDWLQIFNSGDEGEIES
ncbi:MAG: NYN domain-containing protein [Anaerolineales bacterium]